MVPLSTPGDVLRWWRSDVLGRSQHEVAALLSVQPTALSNWENGTRAITIDVGQLDNRLQGGGALGGLLWASTTPRGLEPSRSWSGVFPGPSAPIWLWIRSPDDRVRVEAEWGVVRCEVELDLGPNGMFLVAGASVGVSPLVVHLDRPGWVDFGRGGLPASVPGAEIVPAVNLLRRSSASGAFMQLFLDRLSDRFSRSGQRSRELAALALTAPKVVVSLVSGLARPTEVRSPGPWPPVLQDDQGGQRPGYARLRTARGLSLSETCQRLEVVTGVTVGKDTLRRFESDVGRPHHRLLPAALDHVLGANGHLCSVTLRAGQGPGVVRFPEFWRGPVWLAFEPVSDRPRRAADADGGAGGAERGAGVERSAGGGGNDTDRPARRVRLRWGDWTRILRIRTPVLTSFVCTMPEAPLSLRVPEDVRWAIGLGRRPGALAIDQNWAPAGIVAAHEALEHAERALMAAIRAVQPVPTRR